MSRRPWIGCILVALLLVVVSAALICVSRRVQAPPGAVRAATPPSSPTRALASSQAPAPPHGRLSWVPSRPAGAAAGGTGPRSLGWDVGQKTPYIRRPAGVVVPGLQSGTSRWWLVAGSYEPEAPSPTGQVTPVAVNVDPWVALTAVSFNPALPFTASLLDDQYTTPLPAGRWWLWSFFGASAYEGSGTDTATMAETVELRIGLNQQDAEIGADGRWRVVVQLGLDDGSRIWELDVNVASASWPDWDPRSEYVHVPVAGAAAACPGCPYYYAVMDGAAVGQVVQVGQRKVLTVPVSALVAQAAADNPERWPWPTGGPGALRLVAWGAAVETNGPARAMVVVDSLRADVVAATPTPTPSATATPTPTPTPTATPTPPPTPTPPGPTPTPAPVVWYPPARAVVIPRVDGRLPAHNVAYQCGSLGCQTVVDGARSVHQPDSGGQVLARLDGLVVCTGCDRLWGTYQQSGAAVRLDEVLLYPRGW